MDILKLVIFSAAAAIVMRLLAEASPAVRTVCAIAAAGAVAARFISEFRTLYEAAEDLIAGTPGNSYLGVVFKCLGICFVTQLGCDICRDSGENALASQLELAGKAAVLISALPLFTAAAETVRVLLNV